MFTFWQTSLLLTIWVYGAMYDWRMGGIWLAFFSGYNLISWYVGRNQKNSIRRTLRIHQFSPPSDPNLLVKLEVNLDKALEFMKKKEQEGVRVTLTHLCLKACGEGFKEMSEACGKVVFDKFVNAPSVDIFTLVDIEGKDLTGLTVTGCDKKSISELVEYLSGKIKKIKSKTDKTHEEQTAVAKYRVITLGYSPAPSSRSSLSSSPSSATTCPLILSR